MSKPADGLYWKFWDSPFGRISVGCSDKGIRRLALGPVPGMRAGGNAARVAPQPVKKQVKAGRSN